MLRRKNSSNQSGAQDQGGIPPVPELGAAIEDACGRSSPSPEDSIHPEQSQHANGHEEADLGGSSQAMEGRKLSRKERKEEDRMKKEHAKQEKERKKKEAERREKEQKEAKKREKEKQYKEKKEAE